MNVTALKYLLLAIMLVVSLIAGFIPFLLYRKLTDKSKKSSKYGNLAISLMSCFAGGVILSVALLDILPDAMDDYAELKEKAEWDPEYPFLTLFIGIGFFVVYLSEVLIHSWSGHSHDTEIFNDSLPTTVIPDQRSVKGMNGAVTFALALLIHCFLEGFALGVQGTTFSLSSLFFGIIIHKGLVLFSAGLTILDNIPNRQVLAGLLVLAISLFSPLGIIIGIIVENSPMEEVPKDVVTIILTCFSIGCFFYIAFFDILSSERSKPHSKVLQFVSTLAGFGIIAFAFIFASG